MNIERWEYLKRKYQGSGCRKLPQVNVDLETLQFKEASEALDWIVSEFRRIIPNEIYGCGPCCNDFVLPFIRSLEESCNSDINKIVFAKFDSMTTQEKESVIASYTWFFDTCGDDNGRDKINRLKISLSETEFFKKIRISEMAEIEKARLAKVKNMHLAPFSSKEADICKAIHMFREDLARIQSEIDTLDIQLKRARQAKQRESELYDFEKLSAQDQLNFLILTSRPLAYYEGRLSKILAESELNLLSMEHFKMLFAASKSAKLSKLPQVAKLYSLLKQLEGMQGLSH